MLLAHLMLDYITVKYPLGIPVKHAPSPFEHYPY